jgi:hypothetical protein
VRRGSWRWGFEGEPRTYRALALPRAGLRVFLTGEETLQIGRERR